MLTGLKIDIVKNINKAFAGSLEKCFICPRRCGVNRVKGKTGYCRASAKVSIYSYSPHYGEEPPLSGTRGSGTIFFSRCNMKCVYCQNYRFSQLDAGNEISIEKLAEIMLSLQAVHCHNINLVSPTHYVPQIIAALGIALAQGLDIPITYNTGGYDLADTLKMLEGAIDIYMPDMRYSDNEMAKRYSDAPDYVEHNRKSVREMHGQVGGLVLDKDGIAKKGLIIRLLAMPNNVSGIKGTLETIKNELGDSQYLSIMSQYYPAFKAYAYAEISHVLTPDEYKNVVDYAKFLGLNNGWTQGSPAETDPKFFGTNIPQKKGL
ncbi:MAG: radical SAM protein [Candidatus Omnitrophota bacterium]|nr:radical SAM protein [Candidatus Omnitrophota bacterium]